MMVSAVRIVIGFCWRAIKRRMRKNKTQEYSPKGLSVAGKYWCGV